MGRVGAKDLAVTRASELGFGPIPATPQDWSAKLTGNTSGMPPRTALLPSSTALSLNQSFSLPLASFQLITVAPWSRTSTLSPVGSVAVTRPASLSMLTEACASCCCVVEASAEGLLGRSTMLSCVCCYVDF